MGLMDKMKNKFNDYVQKRKTSARVGIYDNEKTPYSKRFKRWAGVNKERFTTAQERYQGFMNSQYAKQGTSKKKIYGEGFKDYLEWLGTPKGKKTSYQKRYAKQDKKEDRSDLKRRERKYPGRANLAQHESLLTGHWDYTPQKKKNNVFGREGLL